MICWVSKKRKSFEPALNKSHDHVSVFYLSLTDSDCQLTASHTPQPQLQHQRQQPQLQPQQSQQSTVSPLEGFFYCFFFLLFTYFFLSYWLSLRQPQRPQWWPQWRPWRLQPHQHQHHQHTLTSANPQATQHIESVMTATAAAAGVTIFLLSYLHTFSSCWTVASPPPHFIVSINCAVCFTIMLSTYTCLPFVFQRMHFIHATYMLTFYLSITCHASMAYLYINLSVDLVVSLASL